MKLGTKMFAAMALIALAVALGCAKQVAKVEEETLNGTNELAAPSQSTPDDLRGTSTNAASDLEIVEVNFEPLAAGKNVVRLKVHNPLAHKHVMGVDIRTTSRPSNGRGSAWQRQYFIELPPAAITSARFPFKIKEPLSENATIRLQFYSLVSEKQFKMDDFKKRILYRASELTWRTVVQIPQRASESQTEMARALLTKVQSHLRGNRYAEAVQSFTQDYCDMEIMGRAWSRSDAEQLKWLLEANESFSFWDKDEFLSLQPGPAFVEGETLRLEAQREDQTWSFGLVQEAGQWKIDSVTGFRPASAGWANWTERLLPKLQKHSTGHFDIYYYAKSTAERQIGDIARRREEGLARICDFLQCQPEGRIRLVLFEDGQTKRKETGHQGDGWAIGQTIVEVYNERTQLDPYHETVHIVAATVGDPPALFTEGLAVYLSELLGAPALKNLGGGELSLRERCAQLSSRGEWIGLPELMTYTEIGPKESRPDVSYALAGGFVKFLAERYGTDKLLEAYRTLRSSSDRAIQESNAQAFQGIYGQPIEKLEQEWRHTLNPSAYPEKGR